jgi:hypothetical protein
MSEPRLSGHFGPVINCVISVGCWARYRATARDSNALIIRGRVERAKGVVNPVADHRAAPARGVSIATGIGASALSPCIGEQRGQLGDPVEGLVNPSLRDQPASAVDKRDVMMPLGPIDTAEHRHT